MMFEKSSLKQLSIRKNQLLFTMQRDRKSEILLSVFQNTDRGWLPKSQNPNEGEKDQKPLMRCTECINHLTRCYDCNDKIMRSLKLSEQHKRITLKSPIKTQKPIKIQQACFNSIFKVSNLSIRKSLQKKRVLTFEQPVLHKNTILYNVNQNTIPIPRQKGYDQSVYRTRRNLFLNYNYASPQKKSQSSTKEKTRMTNSPTYSKLYEDNLSKMLTKTSTSRRRSSCVPFQY